MSVPTLTNLQFFILRSVADGEKSGFELRNLLSANGVQQSKPAFYELMKRLVKENLVFGRYLTSSKSNQIVTEKLFTITTVGSKAMRKSLDFYCGGNC